MLRNRAVARVLAIAMLTLGAASLTAQAGAVPPANDAFDGAVELTGRSIAVSGSNKDATKEPGEPNHAGEPGGASVWFRWTAPASGETTIETCGSDFDTLLATYQGASVNTLTGVASNDDTCGFQSSITFTAAEGETYRITVDGLDAATGLFSLQLRLAPPNDDFADAVQLDGNEGSVDGTNAGASNEAGEPGLTSKSVWYRWTAPSSDWATFKTCGSPLDTTVVVYTGAQVDSLAFVAYSDDACGVGSSVTFEAAGGVAYSIAVGGFDGDEGDFTLAWNRDPPKPSVVEYPSIAGVAREGQTLTGSAGRWTGSPSFAYAWGRCDAPMDECELIPGATSHTYVVATADIGRRLFLQVTATNVSGATTDFSDVTAVVRPRGPTNSSPPQVIGRAAVGQILDATTGTWTGAQPIQYAYQWQVCNSGGNQCRDLAGDQASTVRVQAAHLASTLRVVVTASNQDGAVPAASSPTGVVVRPRQLQVRRCVVPNVHGKTLRAARTAIRRNQCRVGRIQRRFSNRAKTGRVIAQTPRAGRRLAVGTRVHIVVSKGKRR